MRLQEFTSSRPVTQLGLFLARVLPPRAAGRLAAFIARQVGARRPEVYRIVRQNLAAVVGPAATEQALDALATSVFRNAVLAHYDFFRAQGDSIDALAAQMPIPRPSMEALIALQRSGRGALLLGMHMGNFDLGILTFAAHGLPVQALSIADPPPGFQLFNALRTRASFEITPIAPDTLRQAVRRLRRGGIVLTGVDWPVVADGVLVPFCGRPAYLPLGPARLARMTGAAVFLAACHREPGNGYVVDVLGPLDLQRSKDREADLLANTTLFATFMEQQVRRYPDQWLMFHPFWPAATPAADKMSKPPAAAVDLVR